ncbi:hypothetical protein ABID81_002630 [Frigoribacterium sp. PvP054]
MHDGRVLDHRLARRLRDAGLRWRPRPGDRFVLETEGFEADVFTLSDMTIEAHEYPTGTVLGFNGTTEWALDSVAAADALWLPREDQLRELLGPAFVGLHRTPGDGGTGGYEVRTRVTGTDETVPHRASEAEDAYAQALLAYIDASLRLD